MASSSSVMEAICPERSLMVTEDVLYLCKEKQ
jgi:hypothetical protein